MGGGFGLEGAVEGMAVAAVLNALTTKVTVRSVMVLIGPGWEAFFLHTISTPDELRRFLSPVFVRLRSVNRRDEQSADPISQLERLADLRERGRLTEPEFAAAKRKILER
jgi:hypothetical protein